MIEVINALFHRQILLQDDQHEYQRPLGEQTPNLVHERNKSPYVQKDLIEIAIL